MKIAHLSHAGPRSRALIIPLLAAGAALLGAFAVTSAHADTLYVDFGNNTLVTYNTAGGAPTTFATTGLSNPNGLKIVEISQGVPQGEGCQENSVSTTRQFVFSSCNSA